MTELQPHPDTPPPPPYPTGIVTEPFTLDDLTFSPIGSHGNMECATRTDGELVGDILLDVSGWFARKYDDARGEMTDWQPMRCAAEARAFLVSRVRE